MRSFIFVTLLCAACGPSGLEPEYTGCATDETWRTLDDNLAAATVDDALAPVIAAPADGSTVPANRKIRMIWSRTPTDPGQPDGDVPHPAQPPYAASPDCVDCCTNFNTGALATAHLPPISGAAFDLHFTVDGKLDHRVVTTLQEWMPSDAVWARWRGKQVSVKIYRMDVLRNDPKAGPFTPSKPHSFTVGS